MSEEPDNRPVVYCYDGSEHAREAIVSASQSLRPGPAYVLTVWRSAWATVAAVPNAILSQDTVDEVDNAAQTAANGIAGEGAALIDGAEPFVVSDMGSVWRCIQDFADKHDAKMIVVGARGLSTLQSTMLGSVSHGLVNHSHRPVLVMPPVKK
jgi:nucleotide-binding universal stress UspA family protein